MDRYRKLGEDDADNAYIPKAVFHQVGQLAHWEFLHSRGAETGQLAIVGHAVVENAKLGKQHRTQQSARAKAPRVAQFARVFDRLLQPKYDDCHNKELWDELIGFSDVRDVEITEYPHRDPELSYLVWEDMTGKSGRLTYKSFQAKLAARRGRDGTFTSWPEETT
jgi:hypothetical protein